MKLDETSQRECSGLVQVTQIIVLALGAGVLTFAFVALVVVRPDLQAPPGLITQLAAGFGLLAGGAALAIPPIVASRQCRQIADGTWPKWPSRSLPESPRLRTDAGKLAAVHQSKTIFGAAFVEAGAFFALLAYILEHHVAGLALAGLLLVALLWHLPTQRSVTRWIEQRLDEIEQERQFSR
jgi:hypothetical protein